MKSVKTFLQNQAKGDGCMKAEKIATIFHLSKNTDPFLNFKLNLQIESPLIPKYLTKRIHKRPFLPRLYMIGWPTSPM